MKLYEECLSALEGLLTGPCRSLSTEGAQWPDAGKNQLLFKRDMAYELGGGGLPALSGVLLTDSEERVPNDEILLYGPDLAELKQDSPYARFALIRVDPEKVGDEERLYQAVRKIEYTRYHLNPRGYMLRISAAEHRENVRIGREALAQGLSFEGVGGLFLEGYHRHAAVKAVKLVFVTAPDFPYDRAAQVMEKSENITKTLDHLRQKVKMDCTVCGLKDICAEVEELCKEDFPKDNPD